MALKPHPLRLSGQIHASSKLQPPTALKNPTSTPSPKPTKKTNPVLEKPTVAMVASWACARTLVLASVLRKVPEMKTRGLAQHSRTAFKFERGLGLAPSYPPLCGWCYAQSGCEVDGVNCFARTAWLTAGTSVLTFVACLEPPNGFDCVGASAYGVSLLCRFSGMLGSLVLCT